MATRSEQLPASSVLPSRSLPKGIREFLATESAGAFALVVAAGVALAWANSPWREGYTALWESRVTLRVGSVGVEEDLRHFVNDGLMALFFLVVGLEIKRELVVGDLRDRRVAALPAVAAAGGMLVPAAIYAALNGGAPGADGWGIPMATDIAFALGVLALLGRRCPPRLKLFLLTLAIVDDVAAVVIIAAFYTEDIDLVALALAVAAVLAAVACQRARIWSPPVYVALGVACWLATYESGVHATLAGVAFGLLAPAHPLAPATVARTWAEDLSDEPTAPEMQAMRTIAKETVSVAERLEHRLHPLTSFVVIPVFALANAGVVITTDAFTAPGATRVAVGVAAGLVVGKLVGITAASALAVRLRLAALPEGLTWRHLAGGAAVAGIGFTVSLFITGLAFETPELQAAAKLAVLASSVGAALLGTAVLAGAGGRGGQPPPRRRASRPRSEVPTPR